MSNLLWYSVSILLDLLVASRSAEALLRLSVRETTGALAALNEQVDNKILFFVSLKISECFYWGPCSHLLKVGDIIQLRVDLSADSGGRVRGSRRCRSQRWSSWKHLDGRNAAHAHLPQLQRHTFPQLWQPCTWPIYVCVSSRACKSLSTNHQSRSCPCNLRASWHRTCRISSDISRLPAALGHPEANQSEAWLESPHQTPLAEPSSITVYHLNQTDIWRDSEAPAFICPAFVVLCVV